MKKFIQVTVIISLLLVSQVVCFAEGDDIPVATSVDVIQLP